MKKSIFILSFILLSLGSFSQGYRGKRFSISYQPGVSFINYLSQYPIFHNNIKLGVAVTNSISINLSASYVKRDSFNIISKTIPRDKFNTYHIEDKTIGFEFAFYEKKLGANAPIGKYIGLNIEVGSQNSFRSSLTNKKYYLDELKKNRIVVVSINLGRNFLIQEKFLLGYGIQFGFSSSKNELLNQPVRYLGKPYLSIGILI